MVIHTPITYIPGYWRMAIIDLYVCEPELKKEWNKISTISYESVDRRGQQVSLTIRRYLTSKGLRKDSAALARLKWNRYMDHRKRTGQL